MEEANLSTGSKKDFVIFVLILGAIAFALQIWLNNATQTIAGTIFSAAVIGTLLFWRFRVAIAFIGVVVLLFTKTIDLKTTLEFMNLDVILFLIGMMVMVGMLEDVGFFKYLSAKVIKTCGADPKRTVVVLMMLSAVMAALVDEVTCILFVSMIAIEMCDMAKINPVNYVIAVAFATNIGSSWTVLGNPIGILIALRGGLTFELFIRWALPVGFVSLLAVTGIILIWLRKDMKSWQKTSKSINEWEGIENKSDFKIGVSLFFILIIFIALHHRLEELFGLEQNTLLVASSALFAGMVLLWKREKAKEYIDRKVDWWTLIFFMFLFAKAGTLKYVGLTDVFAEKFMGLASGNMIVLLALILLISTFASSVMDNVVLVATVIPVIQSLSTQISVFPLWWAILFGGCYGGNITMVGSTANIVALGVLEKRKGYFMGLKKWIKIGLVAGLAPAAIALIMLIIQLPIMG